MGVIDLRSKCSDLCNFHWIEDLNKCHQIACSRRSDCGDSAKRCEQKKTARGWVRGSSVFSHSLTSRRTPLSERLEQASHHIISERRSKRASSDCVLCIPIIVTESPSECVAGYLSAVHIMHISKLEIRIAVAFGRP